MIKDIIMCFLLIFTINYESQCQIKTDGVIIVDTVNYSGYISILDKSNYRCVLFPDTCSYSTNEEYLQNGGILYLNPKYFNLLLSSKSKYNIESTCKKMSGYSTQINPKCFIYKHKIIVGVISSDDLNTKLLDFLHLDFKNNVPIWVFTEVCN